MSVSICATFNLPGISSLLLSTISIVVDQQLSQTSSAMTTIDSFFPASHPTHTSDTSCTNTKLHSTATRTEIAWTPQQDYDGVCLTELSPGPRRVCFTARIVNIYNQQVQSKMPQAARGFLRLLLKDGSGVILVWRTTFGIFPTDKCTGQPLLC